MKTDQSKISIACLAISTLFFLLITAPGVSGDVEISVDLNLDRTEATLADSVRMVVSISGSRNLQSEPVIQGLENFTVSQGGTSSRVEIINGKVNAGIDYAYYLQPKKAGTFRIGPAEVKIDGKRYQSRSRPLAVVKPAASEGSKSGALFLSAEISSQDVYVEEQALYTLKLYNRTPIRDISLTLPEHEHLVFKQLGKPREYRSMVSGQSYEVLEVRYAVVAGAAGAYVIGPAKMNMTVLASGDRRRRGHFDDPFFKDPFFSFSSGRPVSLASEPLELKALPLPEEGKPKHFSGLVGKFTMESQLNPATVSAGESATLTVRVTGQGNVQRMPDLKFSELKDAKIYADQPVLKVAQNEKGFGGAKTMKWALVPEKQGRIEIPPMMLSFFDPEKKQYRTLQTSAHILSVLPSDKKRTLDATPSPDAHGRDGKTGKQEIEALGRDILPIHAEMKNLTAQSPVLTGRMLSLVMLLGPFFLYMIAFMALKLRKQKMDTLVQTRSKKAAGEFAKQCRQGGLRHQDLMDALRRYLNNRFALSIGVLTAEEAAGILKSKGANPETTEKLKSIVQRLENSVYTGKGDEATDQAKPLAVLVKAVEREIR